MTEFISSDSNESRLNLASNFEYARPPVDFNKIKTSRKSTQSPCVIPQPLPRRLKESSVSNSNLQDVTETAIEKPNINLKKVEAELPSQQLSYASVMLKVKEQKKISPLKKDKVQRMKKKSPNCLSPSRKKESIKKYEDPLLRDLKAKIALLMNNYPYGIEIEKLNSAFFRQYDFHFSPPHYDCSDFIDLLGKLNDTLYIEEVGSRRLLFLCEDLEETSPGLTVPHQIINSINNILKNEGGAVDIDKLLSVFQSYKNENLSISDLGFSSLADFIQGLGDSFGIQNLNGAKYLYNKVSHPRGIERLPGISSQGTCLSKYEKEVPLKVKQNLLALLCDEFPEGLLISELDRIYKGFYGVDNCDLNPKEYGYTTLSTFISEEFQSLRVKNKGNVTTVEMLTLLPVKPSSQFSKENNTNRQFSQVEVKDFFQYDQYVEILIQEIKTPADFYLNIRSKKHSAALFHLKERLNVFYTEASDKFSLPVEMVVQGSKVAALSVVDNNFYRALVLQPETLTSIKVFYIDYGTYESVPLKNVKALHRIFFDLPAQGIRASLHGVFPPNGKWRSDESNKFVDLVLNKVLYAKLQAFKADILSISLTITDENKDDEDVGQRLVDLGFALKKPINMFPDQLIGGVRNSQSELNSAEILSVRTKRKNRRKRNKVISNSVVKTDNANESKSSSRLKMKDLVADEPSSTTEKANSSTTENANRSTKNANSSTKNASSSNTENAKSSTKNTSSSTKNKSSTKNTSRSTKNASSSTKILQITDNDDSQETIAYEKSIIDVLDPIKIENGENPEEANVDLLTLFDKEIENLSAPCIFPTRNTSPELKENIYSSDDVESSDYLTPDNEKFAIMRSPQDHNSKTKKEKLKEPCVLMDIMNVVRRIPILKEEICVIYLHNRRHKYIPLVELYNILGYDMDSMELYDTLMNIPLDLFSMDYYAYPDVFLQLSRIGKSYILKDNSMTVNLLLISIESAFQVIREINSKNDLIVAYEKILQTSSLESFGKASMAAGSGSLEPQEVLLKKFEFNPFSETFQPKTDNRLTDIKSKLENTSKQIGMLLSPVNAPVLSSRSESLNNSKNSNVLKVWPSGQPLSFQNFGQWSNFHPFPSNFPPCYPPLYWGGVAPNYYPSRDNVRPFF